MYLASSRPVRDCFNKTRCSSGNITEAGVEEIEEPEDGDMRRKIPFRNEILIVLTSMLQLWLTALQQSIMDEGGPMMLHLSPKAIGN